MRILILNYEFPPLGGGAGNATYYLLKEFSKPEHKNLGIDLITSSVNKFKIEKFSDNIKIHYLNIGKKGNLHYQSTKDLLSYSWKVYIYSKKIMKKGHFDLIHTFFGIPCGHLAMMLKYEYKIPYIVSLRGSDVPFYNKRFYWLDKFVFKRLSKEIWKNSKAVITNSKGLKNLALKASPNQKIDVIYNGVDIKEFKPEKKKSENKTKNKKLTIISTAPFFFLIIILNLLLVMILFFFLDKLHSRFLRIKGYERLFNFYIRRSRLRIQKFQKRHDRIGFLALFLFTAIPLPITGAYSATLLSWLTGLDRKKSIVAIFLGIISAGTFIFFLSLKII
jgi:uncharacterized membrane protein